MSPSDAGASTVGLTTATTQALNAIGKGAMGFVLIALIFLLVSTTDPHLRTHHLPLQVTASAASLLAGGLLIWWTSRSRRLGSVEQASPAYLSLLLAVVSLAVFVGLLATKWTSASGIGAFLGLWIAYMAGLGVWAVRRARSATHTDAS